MLPMHFRSPHVFSKANQEATAKKIMAGSGHTSSSTTTTASSTSGEWCDRQRSSPAPKRHRDDVGGHERNDYHNSVQLDEHELRSLDRHLRSLVQLSEDLLECNRAASGTAASCRSPTNERKRIVGRSWSVYRQLLRRQFVLVGGEQHLWRRSAVAVREAGRMPGRAPDGTAAAFGRSEGEKGPAIADVNAAELRDGAAGQDLRRRSPCNRVSPLALVELVLGRGTEADPVLSDLCPRPGVRVLQSEPLVPAQSAR